jgi:hypothetical protein
VAVDYLTKLSHDPKLLPYREEGHLGLLSQKTKITRKQHLGLLGHLQSNSNAI